VYRRRKSTRSIAHVESRAQEAVDGVVGVAVKAAADEPVPHAIDDVEEADDVDDDDESLVWSMSLSMSASQVLSPSPSESMSMSMDDSSAGSAGGSWQLSDLSLSRFSFSLRSGDSDESKDSQ
jgi:hypothetical protein